MSKADFLATIIDKYKNRDSITYVQTLLDRLKINKAKGYDHFKKKRFIMHSDLVSRVNNLVGYNLPDIYLGIPLSIFTINITLGNKNIKNYTIRC